MISRIHFGHNPQGKGCFQGNMPHLEAVKAWYFDSLQAFPEHFQEGEGLLAVHRLTAGKFSKNDAGCGLEFSCQPRCLSMRSIR